MRRTALALFVFCAACPGPDPKPPSWQVVQEHLSGALLRVWGSSSTDVYAVGSDPKEEGSLALHFDGEKWTKLNTGTTGDLWWLHKVADDDIRMVGEKGMILRYKPSDGSFAQLAAPNDQTTLFGCFGRSSSDVWYVGGVPSSKGEVWHDSGSGAVALDANVPTPTTAAVFKVHGFDDGTVWVVGEGGLSALSDSTGSFTDHATGVQGTLFTVHGVAADRVFAVGGFGQGEVLAWDGSMWKDETPPSIGQMNAVWAVDREHAYAAGFNGTFLERKDGAWAELESSKGMKPTLQDLHSMFVDEKGGIWAVGGQLATDPPRDGVMVHYGEEIATGL